MGSRGGRVGPGAGFGAGVGVDFGWGWINDGRSGGESIIAA